MAARPPQQDTSPPDAVEFGIAALDGHLDEAEVSYPATRDEIVRALGDPEVPYDAAGNTVALSEALERLPKRTFDSRSELLDLLHPVFEEYRVSSGGSLLGRLRSLLPF
jgi:mannose/cellobiose epimerase-like protein (N-acyl-D-glucosamine 2-epimerase family)